MLHIPFVSKITLIFKKQKQKNCYLSAIILFRKIMRGSAPSSFLVTDLALSLSYKNLEESMQIQIVNRNSYLPMRLRASSESRLNSPTTVYNSKETKNAPKNPYFPKIKGLLSPYICETSRYSLEFGYIVSF